MTTEVKFNDLWRSSGVPENPNISPWWYSSPIEALSNKQFKQCITKISIVDCEYYPINQIWFLGLGYGTSWNDWNSFTNLDPEGEDGPGSDLCILASNQIEYGQRIVEFQNPDFNNIRHTIEENTSVRAFIYTYENQSSRWGFQSLKLIIDYKTTEPSQVNITSYDTTATNIEFSYNFTNCETPLLYCYSTNSTLQNYPINNSSSQNPSPEEWYNLPLNQNSYNFNISNPQSGQNYYLFIAGYANYPTSNTITINNNSYCYASQEFQLKSTVSPRITEITSGEYKLIIGMDMDFNENYFDIHNAYYFYSGNENYNNNNNNFPTDNQISQYQGDPDYWCPIENNINKIELTRLSKGTTYYIWIAAKLKSGYYPDHQIILDSNNYACSIKYSGTTLNDSRCSEPTITSITSDGITITIEWTGGDSGNYHPKIRYEIYYTTDPTDDDIDNLESVSSDTYTYTYNNNFSNGTTYYFFVRTVASNPNYNSDWSNYREFFFVQRPKVSIGTKIQANQITNLINYLSSTPKPKTVTTGNVILIGDTNNYNSDKATQYKKINADWYNNEMDYEENEEVNI